MNTLNINEYGVEELQSAEMQDVRGGIADWILLAIGGFVVSCIAAALGYGNPTIEVTIPL